MDQASTYRTFFLLISMHNLGRIAAHQMSKIPGTVLVHPREDETPQMWCDNTYLTEDQRYPKEGQLHEVRSRLRKRSIFQATQCI